MASWGSWAAPPCSQAPPATPQEPSCYTEEGYPIYNRSQAGWGGGAQPYSASVTLKYGKALSVQTLQPLLSFAIHAAPSCPGPELTVICFTSSSASSCEESPAAKQAVSTASAGTAHPAPTPPSPQEGQHGACDLRTVVLTGPI